MQAKPRILVFAGSTRAGSFNRKLAKAAVAALEQAGAAVTALELRDFPLPLYDGDLETEGGLPENAKALKELIRNHDAFLIASPEYNGSFPALVKNVIDWTTRGERGEGPASVFRGRPAAIVSTSPGPGGGRRGLRHLRELLEMIGAAVIPTQLVIPRASEAFDAEGNLTRTEDASALAKVAGELQVAAEQRVLTPA